MVALFRSRIMPLARECSSDLDANKIVPIFTRIRLKTRLKCNIFEKRMDSYISTLIYSWKFRALDGPGNFLFPRKIGVSGLRNFS